MAGVVNEAKKTIRKERSRKVGGVPYSTDLVRRKRAELETLRFEAETLSAELATWQATRQTYARSIRTLTNCDGEISSQWRSVAAIESEKRQRAERVNRELRGIMKHHSKTLTCFSKTFTKMRALEGEMFVSQLRPKVNRPVPAFSISQTALDEVTNALDWLRLDTDMMFPVVEKDTTISFRCQCLPLSNSMLMNSITPVSTSVQELSNTLWLHATNTERNPDDSFRFVDKKIPSPLDMNAMASLLEDALCVNAVSSFRKYDEGDRVLLVGTTKWFLADGQLLLQDNNWTVLSASSTDPLHASVMRTCYQLKMESNVPAAVLYAQQKVFNSIGSKMRKYCQSMQDKLLSDVVSG